MKKLAFALTLIFFISAGYAQKIDRSKPPKSGPQPTISLKDPVQFKLKNGMTVLVVENHKLPAVSARFMIDTGPISEGEKAGVINLLGGMLSEGTQTKSKAEFDEAIDQMGANISLGARSASVNALSRYFDKAFMLMAEAIKEPALTEASFDKLKTMSINALKASERSVEAISSRVVNALSYGTDNPLGEFETEETLESITLDDIKNAYRKYVTPSRSYLTIVGDITPAQARKLAEKAFGSWKGNKLNLPEIANAENVGATEINLIDVPNAVQTEVTVVNLVNLPISSPDYFPVLVANEILGGSSTGKLFLNLREKHGFTYGAYSSTGSGRFQTTFKAFASVRNDKVDSAVTEIMKEIKNLRTRKVTDEELRNTKALYTGNFALSLENPAVPASFASNILINNLDKDFYRNFLKNIGKVTAEDVQRVAQKYFNHDNTRIVIVGKAADVKPGLEKLGYPIKMYDRYAAPASVEKASALPDKSAKDVIANYLKAIGGEDELKKVNATHSTGTINLQGMDLQFEEKSMAPNLSKITLSMGGQTVMQDIFDGEKGWRTQMGQKMDYSEDETVVKKEMKGLFNQLFYFTSDYKAESAGSEKVGGKDAYKIKVTSPSGKTTTEWYDATSGYLLKSESTTNVMGQSVSQSMEYSNYKKVGNIMMPHTILLVTSAAAGSQEMTMQLSSVKLNEAVSKDDFK